MAAAGFGLQWGGGGVTGLLQGLGGTWEARPQYLPADCKWDSR